jgi:hypothetical protein
MTAREAGKFELSCWISAALEGLVEAGAELGQTAADVSYWRLSDVRQLARRSLDSHRLQRRVARRRLQHAVTRRLNLPATMNSQGIAESAGPAAVTVAVSMATNSAP